jgi:hypothetical protein
LEIYIFRVVIGILLCCILGCIRLFDLQWSGKTK